jgi:hypothetical protein
VAAPEPAPTPAPKADGGFLSVLPPPTGQSMRSVKRLDAPDVGIPVPASAPGGR